MGTAWCAWSENYEELLDILMRQLDMDSGVLDAMGARPLARAAFVLGRDRRGTDELCQKMYDRMINILEDADAEEERLLAANSGKPLPLTVAGEEPPQYEL